MDILKQIGSVNWPPFVTEIDWALLTILTSLIISGSLVALLAFGGSRYE